MAKKIKKIQLPDGEILELGGTGGGANIFDTKISDHELTFEESEGWALQGTYVYKTGVAGSRYGYPTFIEKCIEEKELGTPTEVTLGDNTITMYINSNGHQFYDIADKEAVDTWYNTYGTAWYYGVDTNAERVFLPRDNYFAVKSVAPVVGNGMVIGLTNGSGVNSGLVVNSNSDNLRTQTGAYGTSLPGNYVAGNVYGNGTLIGLTTDGTKSGIETHLQPDKTKYLYICVGNTSVNEALTDVIDITTSENDTLPLGYSTYQADNLSSAGWLKSTGFFESGLTYVTFYNEYRTRIGEVFSGGYVRSVDEDYTDYDLVIDEGNQTFRLPLKNGSENVVDYENAIILGEPSEWQTLPCDCYVYCSQDSLQEIRDYGFYYTNEDETYTSSFNLGLTYGRRGLGLFLPKGWKVKTFNPTSTIYYAPLKGNGSLYYKVGNAVQHLEVIDMLHEAELNNPFFYGMYQYFQTEPNNASWLASLNQWNSKGIYTDYYNWILENVGKDYFKLSTEEYTDYDWVINEVDETFRLPVKVKGASGSAVVGNGMGLGLTDGTSQGALLGHTIAANYGGSAICCPNNFSFPKVGTSATAVGFAGGKVIGVVTDPTKSGIETSTDGLTLYFYVGEVLQSANLINAGRALEQIAKKTDKAQAAEASMPSDQYIDLTLGASGTRYTAPANGWVLFSKAVTGAGQYIQLWTGVTTRSMGVANGNMLYIYAPVAKGFNFTADYSAGGATNAFRFIYAQGEV